jgi:hypothetical protein
MVKTSKPIVFSVILVLSVFVFTSLVFAINPKAANSQDQNTATRSAVGKEKLTEAKLRVCQRMETAIQKRSARTADRAANMEKVFDSIAARVEAYYTNKLVPQGKTVANYDSLVGNIETKKAAVVVAVSTAQTYAASFNCSGEDPKGQIRAFRGDIQTVIKALKEYRTAVKNLIVALRSVTGTENSNATNSSKVNQ